MHTRKAWLVTWEDLKDGRSSIERPKIVAMIPARTPRQTVQKVVEALFVSEYVETLGEKLHCSLDKERRQLLKHYEDSAGFYYGAGPYLHVRCVDNLRVVQLRNGGEKLEWRELPRYEFDRKTGRMEMVHPSRNEEYVLNRQEAYEGE